MLKLHSDPQTRPAPFHKKENKCNLICRKDKKRKQITAPVVRTSCQHGHFPKIKTCHFI